MVAERGEDTTKHRIIDVPSFPVREQFYRTGMKTSAFLSKIEITSQTLHDIYFYFLFNLLKFEKWYYNKGEHLPVQKLLSGSIG